MDKEKRKRESDSSVSSLGDLESSLTKEKSIKPKKKKEKKHDDSTQNRFATLTENYNNEDSEDNETDNETKHELNQTENTRNAAMRRKPGFQRFNQVFM